MKFRNDQTGATRRLFYSRRAPGGCELLHKGSATKGVAKIASAKRALDDELKSKFQASVGPRVVESIIVEPPLLLSPAVLEVRTSLGFHS